MATPATNDNYQQPQLPNTQHAALIREFGEPEVMKYQDGVDIPELQDDQVLVKVAYAGINPVDYKTRQGKGWGAENIQKQKFDNNQPAILGFDVSGTVVDSNSDEFAIGDRVAALTFTGGCYAQYVAVDTKMLAKVPESVTLEQAGALPCIGQTALQFVEFADIKEGEHVVINAPAGGVGHLLIQLLMDKVSRDDIKVTVICSPEKYAKLGELIDTDKLAGWIDYTKDEAFPDLQADVLLDLVGDDAGAATGVEASSATASEEQVNEFRNALGDIESNCAERLWSTMTGAFAAERMSLASNDMASGRGEPLGVDTISVTKSRRRRGIFHKCKRQLR